MLCPLAVGEADAAEGGKARLAHDAADFGAAGVGDEGLGVAEPAVVALAAGVADVAEVVATPRLAGVADVAEVIVALRLAVVAAVVEVADVA